jgi:AcrR family transcriptional regulator
VTTTSEVPGTGSRRAQSPARRRILDTAHLLFYTEGIHTVGIDRIIAEAGVAKATFYHHFPAKEDLVRTYLLEEAARQRAAAARLRETETDPLESLYTAFDVLGEIGCRPGYRGCPFVNAAAEYPDAGHPVRQIVNEHRRWFRGLIGDLLTAAEHPDAERTADMLFVLRDGLVVSSYLDDADAVRAGIRATIDRLLAV